MPDGCAAEVSRNRLHYFFSNDPDGWLKQGWHTGGFHEMLKGPEKVEVLECIVKWILAHSNASVEATATTPSA